MRLIAYYVAFMILGDLAAYLIGLISERQFGSQVSLIVFLTLYFLFLWIAWVIAVWMTEPKRVEATDGKPTRGLESAVPHDLSGQSGKGQRSSRRRLADFPLR